MKTEGEPFRQFKAKSERFLRGFNKEISELKLEPKKKGQQIIENVFHFRAIQPKFRFQFYC